MNLCVTMNLKLVNYELLSNLNRKRGLSLFASYSVEQPSCTLPSCSSRIVEGNETLLSWF